MPHLERVREGLVAIGGALLRVIEKRDVLDVEPVHLSIPTRGDLSDQLVLASLIAFGITDRDGKQLVR